MYDGFDAWAENRHGAETTSWLKAAAHPLAAEQIEYERNAAYGIGPTGSRGPLGPIAPTPNPAEDGVAPYGARTSTDYPVRNAWVTPEWEQDPNDGKIYPKRERGKYLKRPEVGQRLASQTRDMFFRALRFRLVLLFLINIDTAWIQCLDIVHPLTLYGIRQPL